LKEQNTKYDSLYKRQKLTIIPRKIKLALTGVKIKYIIIISIRLRVRDEKTIKAQWKNI
jgi:hypothetical protein